MDDALKDKISSAVTTAIEAVHKSENEKEPPMSQMNRIGLETFASRQIELSRDFRAGHHKELLWQINENHQSERHRRRCRRAKTSR